MKMNERYLTSAVTQALGKKMVFLSGPRQVGKTALGLRILGEREESPRYLNFDFQEDRQKMLKGQWPETGLVILDEIHKYPKWRNWLKGVFDKSKSRREFLITGSARLDVYRRGGDSLLGRYRHFRLHPLSVKELGLKHPRDLDRLLVLGGFPEPYFGQNEAEAKIWRKDRRSLIIRDDVKTLESIKDIHSMEILAERLPALVGSPLSINALAQDLQVAHKTLSNWVAILERLYYAYRIYPYGSDKIRAVKKEAKLYLWDWSDVESPGARFENMVAGHLLKYCHHVEDTLGDKMELRYVRDTDAREVDFVVIKNNKPVFAVEAKHSETKPTASMHYFLERTEIKKMFLVHATSHKPFFNVDGRIESISALEFLGTLV